MRTLNLSGAIVLIAIGCSTPAGTPLSERDARMQTALELKQACVRAQVENGVLYGTAGRISAECWRRARRAAGVR